MLALICPTFISFNDNFNLTLSPPYSPHPFLKAQWTVMWANPNKLIPPKSVTDNAKLKMCSHMHHKCHWLKAKKDYRELVTFHCPETPPEALVIENDNKSIFAHFYFLRKRQDFELLGNNWGVCVSPAALYYAQGRGPKTLLAVCAYYRNVTDVDILALERRLLQTMDMIISKKKR